MSAYIVEKNHIVYLTESALQPSQFRFSWYHGDNRHEIQPGDYERAAEVANMLWRENIASVSARYPGESSDTLPGPTDHAGFVVTAEDFTAQVYQFDPVQVLKACDCYEYQSCEHDGWESSEAHAFIESLRGSMIGSLPGYEEAEWGAPKKTNLVSLYALAGGRKV